MLTPDVLVVGGGAAGIAAAVGAADRGARTLLLERAGSLGGMATQAMVGTVCGLYTRRTDTTLGWAVGGFARDFATALADRSETTPASWRDGLRFLPYAPHAFRMVADAAIEGSGAVLSLHTVASDVGVVDGRIDWVDAIAWDRKVRITPAAVVDTTGTALVSALAGETLRDRERHQAPAFVVGLAGCPEVSDHALRLGLLRATTRAVQDGSLPRAATAASIVPGSRRGGQAYLKLGLLGGLASEASAVTSAEREARGLAHAVVAHLRATEPGFELLQIVEEAAQLGVRTGRRPVGRATLELADVLEARRHPDDVALGAWPMEVWGDDNRPQLTLAAEGSSYGIPMGCLRSATRENLWFAGRCLSATDDAVASARVIGTCLATGYAAGRLASVGPLGGDLADEVAALHQQQVALE